MAFSGNGTGTELDPYQITDLAQLYEIFDNLTSHFILMNDIDASDTSSGADTLPYNGLAGWVPVNGSVFSGVLDGDNYSITGLYTDIFLSPSDTGLLYSISGTVKNFSNIDWVVDSKWSQNRFGGVAGLGGANGSNVINVKTKIHGVGEYFNYLGGIIGDLKAFSSTIEDCYSDIYLECTIGSIRSTGGIVGVSSSSVSIIDCGTQMKLDAKDFGSSKDVGGAIGKSAGGGIQGFKSNIVINSGINGTAIGGILGTSSSGFSISDSWVKGVIYGNSKIGGIVGLCWRESVTRCWADVDIFTYAEQDVKSGLLCGGKDVAGSNNIVDSLAYGNMNLNTFPNNLYSADTATPDSGHSNLYYDIDRSGYAGQGNAGDTTLGVGLTSLQLKDIVYLTNNTSLPIPTTFKEGGMDGYLDLVLNPYDESFIKYEKDVVFSLVESVEKIDQTSFKIIGSVISEEPVVFTERRIEYGPAFGEYDNIIIVDSEGPFEAVIENLFDGEKIYYRVSASYNSSDYNSPGKIYYAYAHDQINIDPIVVDDYIPQVPNSYAIHGSVLVDINGEEYIFLSPRSKILEDIQTNVYSDIVKYKADDYDIYDYVSPFDEDGNKLSDLNQISYCNGYIWTIGRSSNLTGNRYTYLVRVNPSNLDIVYFRVSPNTSADSHGTDSTKYLFIGSQDIIKIDTDELLGSYTPGEYVSLPQNSVKETYDSSSQGYYLDVRSPESFTHSNKGHIHSFVVDGEYLYAEYTSQSDFNIDAQENECELHKVKISDMSASGYARIPKSTDDATQNSTYIFLGVETQPQYNLDNPNLVMGINWGSAAVRKSDMTLFAIPRLHNTDEIGITSYASTVFGDYFIDLKTSNVGYVLDVNDMSKWDEIDQFAPAGTWELTSNIGELTLKAFRLYETYSSEEVNKPIVGVANEILFDSRGYFHSTGWDSAFIIRPSSLSRYLIPDISFIGKPTLTTGSPTISETHINSIGIIISENGAEVTAVGFEYADNIDFTNPTSISATKLDFTMSVLLSALSMETIYIRSWGENSEGKGYGNIVSMSLSSSPTVTTNDATINGTQVTLNASRLENYSPIMEQGFDIGTTSGVYDTTEIVTPPTNNPFTYTFGATEGQTIYFRAYATNANGTSYGEEKSIFISPISVKPTVTTSAAVLNGLNVTLSGTESDNGSEIIGHGFEIGIASGNYNIIEQIDLGEFTHTFSGNEGTTYYFRAFATNIAGTSYGEEKSILVSEDISSPTVTSLSPILNGVHSTLRGSRENNGSLIIEQGFEIGVSSGNYNNTIITSPSTENPYSHIFTGELGQTYYFRAYAINSVGTSYGEEIIFHIPDDDYSSYKIYGLIRLNGMPVEGAKILLINQEIDSIVDTAISDESGYYEFTNGSPNIDYSIMAYYTVGSRKYSSIPKTFRRFKLD